jgi:spermidine synthase
MPQAADANRTTAAVSTATLILLCTCFVLSGIAALIYQTAWTRQFAIVFGTSELAVATVLAAYMGGLALGAWLAERFLPKVTRPVLTYALLEIGIAASAILAVPALLWLANQALLAIFGNQPVPPGSDSVGTTTFYLASSFVALALPTTLMGATLPVLARYAISNDVEIGRRIGVLYAMNTAGAVLGALLAAFVLLPEFGLTRTIWVGAVFNGVVVLLALMLANRIAPARASKGYSLGDEPEVEGALTSVVKPQVAAPPPRPRAPIFTALPGAGWVLPLMLLAGAVAFFQEVLWARMLSHVVGSSIYAFGVMAASFLVGIALGGGIGAALARTRERAATLLAAALIIAAAAAAVAYLLLENLLPARGGLLQNTREWLGMTVPLNALFSGLLLLPMTLAIGMTYPLAVRVLARDADDAAAASARVYAWNTVGAIVGALLAAFIAIPALRYEGAIQVGVFASAALGIAAAWVLLPPRRVFAVAATLVAIAGCAFFRPAPPMRLLVTSPLNVGDQARVLYYDVGRSASVVMLANDGGLSLRTNGLPEAMMDGPGSVAQYSGEYWLAPLTVIARPETRDMLVVGYGGGVVIEAAPPSVRHIDVIELEPRVLEANRATAHLRKRNPLIDPRVNVITNDARGALRLTSRRYDAIVSQPSHPWTAGASHLYTREFVALARDHLNPGGVFVQWMNVDFMDEALMRSLTATLLGVFPEVRVYRPDPRTVLFLASDLALNPELYVAETGLPLRNSPLHYARYGINTTEDLVVALALDTEGARRFAAGAPLVTDDDNRFATSNVFEKGRGMNGDAVGRLVAGFDPLQNPDSIVYTRLRDSLSFPYLARRASLFVHADGSTRDRVRNMTIIIGQGPDAEYVGAQFYKLVNQASRGSEKIRLAIDEFPRYDPLREEYLRRYLAPLAAGTAPPEILEVARGLGPRPTALLAATRHAMKGEWAEVRQLDRALAQIAWTDAWHEEATQLRANWRLSLNIPEQQKQLGDEALMLIDRVALLNRSVDVLGLRIRAGLVAARPEIVTESVAALASRLAGLLADGAPRSAEFTAEIDRLQQVLDIAARLPGADAARVAEVRGSVSRLKS